MNCIWFVAMQMTDSYQQKGLRLKLVTSLREQGIADEQVLAAIQAVPRHLFFGDSTALGELAYEDRACRIDAEQTISRPLTVARQTELLEVKPGEKVLEIGLGSGYQATVLMMLKARVYSIERQKVLFERTSRFLPALRDFLLANMPKSSDPERRSWKNESPLTSIKCFYGDGFEGQPMHAPFDKIIVTAAVSELPRKLLAQLNVGGKIVLPFGTHRDCDMVRITKHSEGQYSEEVFGKFGFVPMLKGKQS